MEKIIFINRTPFVTHNFLYQPTRIQRIDKATITLDVIVECEYTQMIEFVFSLDPCTHSDYLLEIEGERVPVKRWLDTELKGVLCQEKLFSA